jgi:FAD/FMN-containing dehydrogenase
LVVSVKGGGHNIAGYAVCDGGMMIDLSLMRSVHVDRENKTARVGGGCLLGDVDHETQRYGLAVSAGIVSHTGVAGLTLGGGFGWISRKHGLTVDNLISAEVVTAEGEVLTASKNENPDLFWGLCGGSGNFGIVTSFEFQCVEIGSEVFSGIIVKRFEDAKKYLKFYREYTASLPDEMTVWTVIRQAPPLPFLPEDVHGKMAVIIPFVYLGDQEQGESLLKPIRELGESHGEHIGFNPWAGWQAGFDGLLAHGSRNYWKSHHLKELTDDCIDIALEFASNMPSSQCEVFIAQMGGAPSRVASDATAYVHRYTPFVMNIHTRWEDPADDGKCRDWSRGLFEKTKPWAQGVYVNFISETDEARIRDAYTDDVWNKLVQLKNKYDPNNFFSMNQNIKPSK